MGDRRWLIVVRGDRSDLAERLRARHGEEADVLLDRRHESQSVESDRRRPLGWPETLLWQDFGYRWVYRFPPLRSMSPAPPGARPAGPPG